MRLFISYNLTIMFLLIIHINEIKLLHSSLEKENNCILLTKFSCFFSSKGGKDD
nr:hypothetical protein GTC16762_08960 [Pigmentibacter ruber]